MIPVALLQTTATSWEASRFAIFAMRRIFAMMIGEKNLMRWMMTDVE
jgi:hypothetical protein